MTYSKSGYFGWAGGGKSGAIVDLWAASRFGSPPAENTAPPSGSPDAGPVTTGINYGGPGAFTVSGISVLQDYYLRIQYGGNAYWSEVAANTLTGAPVASGIVSISSPDSSITIVGSSTPTLELTPLTGDVTTSASAATLVGTSNVETIISSNATVAGALPKSTVTTNGDLIVGTGSATVGRLGVGATGTVLEGGTTPAWGVLPGTLLATKYYAPGSAPSYTLTTSLAAVDTTNATLAFTVPPSGNVTISVEAEATLVAGSGASYVYACLFTHNTTTVLGNVVHILSGVSSASVLNRCHMTFYLSGQTPGALQVDLAGAYSGSGAAASFNVQGVTTATGSGPLVMQAFAS